MHVGGVTSSGSVKKCSDKCCCGRVQVRTAPASVPHGSSGADDQDSAPGFQDRPSTGGYHSNLKRPDKHHNEVSDLSLSDVTNSHCKKLPCVEEQC